ncbi:DUF3888 domain-containing protein [Cytobacillus sp. Hm23]
MSKTILLFLFLLIPFAHVVEASDQSECEKALLSLMFEDIYKAVNENYEFEGVQFENWKITDLKMTNGLTFDITVQISTFIGAHNTIGTDTLKFKREIDGLQLVSFDHIPSEHKDEILEWYFNISTHP